MGFNTPMKPQSMRSFIHNSTSLRTAFHMCLGSITIILAGCQPSTSPTSTASVDGTFTLRTVDGLALPAKVQHGNAAVEVLSGSMAFNSDGTCVSKTVFRPPAGREVHREVTADYVRDGSNLRMKWHGAGKTTGTLQGDAFTMNNEGMVFAYQR